MSKVIILIILMITVKTFAQEDVPSNQKSDKVDNAYESPSSERLYGFRNKFYTTFDSDKVNGKGVIKSVVTFVITSEGKITDIKATGTNMSMNNEMERTINEMNKFKWFPKKIDGKPTDSNWRLPMTMTFEGN